MKWVTIDETTWPVDVDGRTELMLRFKSDGWTRQRVAAAAVLAAYAYLTDPALPEWDAVAALKRARVARSISEDEE